MATVLRFAPEKSTRPTTPAFARFIRTVAFWVSFSLMTSVWVNCDRLAVMLWKESAALSRRASTAFKDSPEEAGAAAAAHTPAKSKQVSLIIMLEGLPSGRRERHVAANFLF